MPARRWFITGVSAGFGRRLAELALGRGDTVVGTVRRAEQAAQFSALTPGHSFGLVLDLTSGDAAVRECVQRAVEAASGLDVVVNNAGYGLVGAVEEVSETEARHVMETNFFGALEVVRAALPHMRDRRAGHIINISSMAGFSGSGGFGLYNASKFALEGLSEALRGELAPLGIRVTIVEPGAFRTDWAGRSIVTAARSIDDYAAGTKARAMIEAMDGTQPGDPDKAARAILDLVDADDPPLRLVLGGGMVDRIKQKLAAVEAEVEAWRHVSDSTDFDAVTA